MGRAMKKTVSELEQGRWTSEFVGRSGFPDAVMAVWEWIVIRYIDTGNKG
jgi:hypothetical protein